MKVTVQNAHLLDDTCVEVIGKMGRQTAEFVVYFSRHATISGGYQFAPPEEGYLYVIAPPDRDDARVLPREVKLAAEEAYKERYSRPS